MSTVAFKDGLRARVWRVFCFYAIHPGFRRRRDKGGVRVDELRRSGAGADVCGTVESLANRSRKRRACDRGKRGSGAARCGTQTRRDYGGWRGACGHGEARHERENELRAAEM